MSPSPGDAGLTDAGGDASAGASNSQSIAIGFSHVCAMTAAGGVKCWGSNGYGQLGNSTLADSRTPVDVTGLSSGVTSIAAGAWHTCARLANGAAKCWGFNRDGQLGTGNADDSLVPIDVAGLSSGVLAVSSDVYQSCALMMTGAVKCWGDNSHGELGNGGSKRSFVPVDVSGLSSASSISSGGGHTCVTMASGAVKCWGYNYFGKLGIGSTVDSPVPVTVSGLSSAATEVSAGYNHTCARLITGTLECWGHNLYGQLGNNATTNSTTPVDVVGISSVTSVSAGAWSTCARMNSGSIKCWGENTRGQLGDGSSSDSSLLPREPSGLSAGAGAIVTQNDTTCARTLAGGIKCWGQNDYGQLGGTGIADSRVPVDIVGFP